MRETEAVQKMLRDAAAAQLAPRSHRMVEGSRSLGTTVEIKAARKGRGKLIVHYASLDHLEQLLKKLR